MVQELGTPGHGGLKVLQPVIPPLSGAGGARCSVKPASRCALKSRSHETWAFAQDSRLNSQLGAGRPADSSYSPTQQARKLFYHSEAPTWVTSWSNPTRQAEVFPTRLIKIYHFRILESVGLRKAKTSCILACLVHSSDISSQPS